MAKNWIVLLLVVFAFGCEPDPVGEGDDLKGEGAKKDTVENKEPVLSEIDSPLSSDIAAYKTVVNIIRETGLAQNFVILPGEVKDVKAYIKNNERILEYNPDFMEKLDSGDSNWRGISVLAREIGHHLSGHDLVDGEETEEERLEADKYAGYVLFKMGASLDEAVKALEASISEDSLNVSPKNDRLAALVKGYNNAKTLATDSTKIEENKAIVVEGEKETNKAITQVKPDYVYKVFLVLDSTMYFVDNNDVIFMERGAKPREVGLKKESDKPGFDWIFVKGEDSYGVDIKGRLWAFSIDGTFKVVGQAVKLSI